MRSELDPILAELVGVKKGTAPPLQQIQLPAGFVLNTYDCLCPQTVLLQALAAVLPIIDMKDREEGMGSNGVLYKVLNGMQDSLGKANPIPRPGDETGFIAGFANCIMLHESNSRHIVIGTVARYKTLKGLQHYATMRRNEWLERLRNDKKVKPADRANLEAAEAISKFMMAENKANRPIDMDSEQIQTFEKIRIPGSNVTLTPRGKIKYACLTDYVRMDISRPPKAADVEKETKIPSRLVQNFKSCAEWGMACFLAVSPDPEPPLRLTARSGHQGSRSLPNVLHTPEKSAASSQNVAIAPITQLPTKMGRPVAGKHGRAPSPPGPKTQPTVPLVDRTKTSEPATTNLTGAASMKKSVDKGKKPEGKH